MYAGLVQAGRHLQNERAWVTLCCLRSSIVKNVEAGMSQILKIILKMIFQSEHADVLNLGLLLQGPPDCGGGCERKLLQMTFAFMVQDGQAHKMCWSLKGDSGSRFCGLCRNVFSHHDDEEGVSDVSCWTSLSQLQFTNSQEVFQSWDRMAARQGSLPAGQFKMWQQACGITFSKEAVLADLSLRCVLNPCRQYMLVCSTCWMVWMHGTHWLDMWLNGKFQLNGSILASMWQSCFLLRE